MFKNLTVEQVRYLDFDEMYESREKDTDGYFIGYAEDFTDEVLDALEDEAAFDGYSIEYEPAANGQTAVLLLSL